jgi:hypothetical protein
MSEEVPVLTHNSELNNSRLDINAFHHVGTAALGYTNGMSFE